MGRQWLQKNKEITAHKRGKIVNKLVREIQVAARAGVPDPDMNPRLAVAVEAARKQSVSNDTIQRAIQKGSGTGADRLVLEAVSYEGFAPHHVPVVVECLTDNVNRTAPEMRVLFRQGQFGARVKFLFDSMGIVEATHEGEGLDLEEAAIEAGAQDVEPLEEVPAGSTGGRFFTEPRDLDVVSKALRAAGWTATTSEIGFVPKDRIHLEGAARDEVVAFLEALDDHDDVQRIYSGLA